jgi:uncharacterized membrane protein YgdD (TMEM256/DUF423 family)
MNVILLFGSILGLLSVMMGAYVDHGLAQYLSDKTVNQVATAVRYHQLYAVVICVIALLVPLQTNVKIKRWLTISAYVFLIGVALFSFSIYLAAMLNAPKVLAIAPLGGTTLMLGWVCLMPSAFLKIK